MRYFRRLLAESKAYLIYARNIVSPRASLKSFEAGSHDIAFQEIDEGWESALVDRIANAYRRTRDAASTVPPIYRPQGAWTGFTSNFKAYIDAIDSGDMKTLARQLRNFFRNDGSKGFYTNFAALHSKNRGLIVSFLNRWLHDLDYVRQTTGATLDEFYNTLKIGNPWGYYMNDNLILWSAPKHYYVKKKIGALMETLSDPIVVEIGGGFGGLACYIMRDHRRVTYLDFDLPETMIIVSYYLGMAFPDRKILLYGEGDTSAVGGDCFRKYDIILLPNFLLPRLADDCADLTINISSLSEMDRHTVNEYVSQICSFTKGYFYHLNSNERMVNNKHIEVPASEFPVQMSKFKKIYWRPFPSKISGGRYVEVLYKNDRA